MGIKQLNGTYIKSEDRLMVRFNTSDQQEYRLWFTRLISMSFLEATGKVVQKKIETKHNPQIAQVIQEFQKEGVKRSSDFKTPYQPAKTLPLGAEPTLVTGFNLTEKEGQFFIAFKLADGKNISLVLPAQALQSIAILIEQLVEKARWQDSAIAQSPSNPEQNPNSPSGNKVVH
jgi:hypothetical protein